MARTHFCRAPGDGARLIATRRQPLMSVILQSRIRNVERACRRRIGYRDLAKLANAVEREEALRATVTASATGAPRVAATSA